MLKCSGPYMYKCVLSILALIHIGTRNITVSEANHGVNGEKYKSNPLRNNGEKMLLSICRKVPNIMALTHLWTEKYHKIIEAYKKDNSSNLHTNAVHM